MEMALLLVAYAIVQGIAQDRPLIHYRSDSDPRRFLPAVLAQYLKQPQVSQNRIHRVAVVFLQYESEPVLLHHLLQKEVAPSTCDKKSPREHTGLFCNQPFCSFAPSAQERDSPGFLPDGQD